MSPKPISRSADLTRLRNEGYDLEIRSDHLLVKDVPYVTAGRIVKRGILVMPLKLAGDVTVKPENHVAHFIGEYPCRADGTPIDSIRNDSTRRELGPGVVIDHTFSAKPMPSGAYENYYDKVTQYVTILSGYARVVEPGVTAKTFRPVPAGEGEEETVFKYIDTASTRAEIGSVTAKYSVSGAGARLDPDGARSGAESFSQQAAVLGVLRAGAGDPQQRGVSRSARASATLAQAGVHSRAQSESQSRSEECLQRGGHRGQHP